MCDTPECCREYAEGDGYEWHESDGCTYTG